MSRNRDYFTQPSQGGYRYDTTRFQNMGPVEPMENYPGSGSWVRFTGHVA